MKSKQLTKLAAVIADGGVINSDQAAVKSAAGCEEEGYEEDGFDYKVSRLTIAYDQIYVLPD
jgi:hypothetical protein